MKHYPNGLEYKINYDSNIVEVEEVYKGKSIGKKIYTYSKNKNLIKKETYSGTYYYSYNERNLLIKEVYFKNNQLQTIRGYKYNQNDDLIYQYYKSARDLMDGTIAEQISRYEYDNFNNIIYEYNSGDMTNRTYEIYYKFEYN